MCEARLGLGYASPIVPGLMFRNENLIHHHALRPEDERGFGLSKWLTTARCFSAATAAPSPPLPSSISSGAPSPHLHLALHLLRRQTPPPRSPPPSPPAFPSSSTSLMPSTAPAPPTSQPATPPFAASNLGAVPPSRPARDRCWSRGRCRDAN